MVLDVEREEGEEAGAGDTFRDYVRSKFPNLASLNIFLFGLWRSTPNFEATRTCLHSFYVELGLSFGPVSALGLIFEWTSHGTLELRFRWKTHFDAFFDPDYVRLGTEANPPKVVSKKQLVRV